MSGDVAEPTWVVPDGWELTELARTRMLAQLAAAPGHLAAVVAPTAPLAAGESYRSRAQRAALRPADEVEVRVGGVLAGAAVARPGVPATVHGGGVLVDAPLVLVDHGCHVHDPAVAPALAPAGVLSRPAFPSGAVVAFLLGRSSPSVSAWARDLANELLRMEVEARLVVPGPVPGPHLAAPCRFGEESMARIGPDVVVALDAAAREAAPGWCRRRSTTIIERDGRMRAPSDLVPWRLGVSRGRVRARVGPSVTAPELAALVNRLASGPQPEPPARTGPVPVVVDRPRPDRGRPVLRRSVAVVAGVLGHAAAAQHRAFADAVAAVGDAPHLLAAEAAVEGGDRHDDARAADLLVLWGAARVPGVVLLAQARAAAGRPSVVWVGQGDLDREGDEVRPGQELAALLATCRGALGQGPAAVAALRRRDVPAVLVPPLLRRGEAAALDRLRARGPDAPRLGWHVGDLSHADDDADGRDQARAVVEAVLDDGDVPVEVAGAIERMPADLLSHPAVDVVAGDPRPARVARWSAQLWTPAPTDVRLGGEVDPLLTAGWLGVPTVVAGRLDGAVGLADPELCVDGDWRPTSRALLDDRRWRAWRSAEARRRAGALTDEAAGVVATRGVLDWATAVTR